MSKGEHLGYSQHGCITRGILSLVGRSSDLQLCNIISVIGCVFLVIFESIAYAVLLQVLLKALSQKMEACKCSFDYYGMFWGLSATLFAVLTALLYKGVTHLSLSAFNPHIRQVEYATYIWPVVLASPIIFCVPMAIYFGIKFRFATPSVYLLPAKLLCCCSEKRARILVTSLTLWVDLVAAHCVVAIGTFVLFAFPVAPFVVAINVMLLVLTFMCLTYIMALVFTICASVCTRKCLRSNVDCCATVRAAMLIPLLLAIICFSITFALSNQRVNRSTQQNGFYVLVKSLFAPVLLAAVSFGLKRFISSCMHWSPDDVEGGDSMDTLHEHVYEAHQAIDNVVVDLMH